MEEAKKLLAQAENAARPRSFLFISSSPNYLEASDLYNRAANAFKASREWSEAAHAFEQAAEMDLKGGEQDESSRKLLSAASCYKKCDVRRAIELTEKAIQTLLKAGRFHMVATHEKDIAELYETHLDDLANAMIYYERAAERYAGEDSISMAQSCQLKMANLAALAGEMERAAQIYEEAASSSLHDQLKKYSVRDYLFRAGLCRLAGGDQVAARRSLESYSTTIDISFSGTREYKLLFEMLEAMEKGDVDGFTEAISSFDKTNPLDDWKTKILLKIKNGIISEESDLT